MPVLVWMHGGALTNGSGSVPIYDGRALAARGVVVVTINYRLGVFGFLAHPELTAEAKGGAPTNWGLQDQVAALKWVHDNIAAFGGDPAQVTVAGQSAGSEAAQLLMLSPVAKGLFRGAISESGPPSLMPPTPLAAAEQRGLALQRALGAASLAELRALPADQLLKRQGQLVPVVDGVLLPDRPETFVAQGPFADVPVIIGMVANESPVLPQVSGVPAATMQSMLARNFGASASRMASFYPADSDAERLAAAARMQQDLGRASIWKWAEARIAHGRAPVYAYVYAHPEPGPQSAKWKTFHSSEIPYVFETLEAAPERGFTAEDQAIARDVSTRWLNFVAKGDPNSAGHGGWPRFDAARPELMRLGDVTGAEPILPSGRLSAYKAYLQAGGDPRLF